jgi:hypothetical protein
MDVAFARGRHAAVMGVVFVACSSSPSNGGDPGDGAVVAMACAADPGCVAYQACIGDDGY